MSTETIKRCDIFDTKRDVLTISVTVVEVLDELEPLNLKRNPDITNDGATIRSVRGIKSVTLDMGPKALERLLACVVKGTTPPGGKGEA